MPRVRANGISIYYEEEGEGFPLVLLHPWPTDHAMWMYQVPVFSTRYRVITPDSRGLGRSDKPGYVPNSGYTVTGLAKDVAALLDELGIGKVFITGLSLGGAVAMKFTIDYPERTQAAVWMGAGRLKTAPESVLPAKRSAKLSKAQISRLVKGNYVEPYLETLESKGYLGFWRNVWKPNLGALYHKDFAQSAIGSYLIRYFFEERYAEYNKDPSGVIAILKGLAEENHMDGLGKVKVPAAVVVGADDPTVPDCKKQKALCPSAEYHEIKRSGHMCSVDQAGEFNRIMWSFLERHSPSS